ncbi:MAG: hypothetical protein ABR587_13960 [Candidatus Binatia bacterium]
MSRRAGLLRYATGILAAAALAMPVSGHAQADPCDPVAPVFSGDPCDPVTGPYPMLPGLPLVLPQAGPTGPWTDGPPLIDTSLSGDVDLAVRVGFFPNEDEVPPPAGSEMDPTLLQYVAGGGGASQGAPVVFTTFVTDGPGTLPYGTPLAGLDERPVAVFAYADLDGDGVVGPTDLDGKGDNELERQEAIGHVGRQVGQIDGDRFSNQLAVRIGAPASIGGLRISLVAGMYTGNDPNQLWSNGTPIFTNWPFFPPLDPLAIVYLAEANPPDPTGPNILFYQPAEFLLPTPDTTGLVEAFALQANGSNPSTDQYISLSGPPVGARLFRDVTASSFSASSRLAVRPAPPISGSTRRLVTPAGEVAVKTGRNVQFRLMPVDALGNIADPAPSGVPARIRAEGGLVILSPDSDKNPFEETLNIDKARGQVIRLGTDGVSGRARVTVYDPPPALPIGLDQALVFASSSGKIDADDDGIDDDGDGSGTIGDRPCTAADVTSFTPCDDNCPEVVNPSQNDSDGDGQGNCCDGACVIDDSEEGCMECPQAASRFRAVNTRARTALRPRSGDNPDVVRIRALLRMEDGQEVAPDTEQVEITMAEGDRLHYFVQLPGVFTITDDRPTYEYLDETAALGGIYKAKLRTTRRGIRARIRAKQVDIIDTEPGEVLENGLVLAVTIGDDTFTRHLKCTTPVASVRCVSSN